MKRKTSNYNEEFSWVKALSLTLLLTLLLYPTAMDVKALVSGDFDYNGLFNGPGDFIKKLEWFC